MTISQGKLNYNGPARVVFNSYYKSLSDEKIEAELSNCVTKGVVDEVLFVRKDRPIRRFKK